MVRCLVMSLYVVNAQASVYYYLLLPMDLMQMYDTLHKVFLSFAGHFDLFAGHLIEFSSSSHRTFSVFTGLVRHVWRTSCRLCMCLESTSKCKLHDQGLRRLPYTGHTDRQNWFCYLASNSDVRRSRWRRCCTGCKGPTGRLLGQDESRHQELSPRSESIKIGLLSSWCGAKPPVDVRVAACYKIPGQHCSNSRENIRRKMTLELIVACHCEPCKNIESL